MIEQRKSDHLTINLEDDVASTAATGFEHYRFVHRALPDLDFDTIDTSTTILGRSLRVPFLISSMTGGMKRGRDINRRLATVAQAAGSAMGIGSQRAAIENPDLIETFRVRDVAPDILLFANLGAIQLNYGYTVDHCRRAVEMIGADALVLHLNPLQEALQPEGNHDFSSLLHRIAAVCAAIEVPVIVKEVGFGISGRDAALLAGVGVAAIDVAGAGGTSWSRVEERRATSETYRRMGETFAGWGIPTATSLRMVREQLPELPLIASGGLRTGLDAARAIALGATLAGFAGPMLHAANASEDAAHEMLQTLAMELRLAMFGTGAATLSDLLSVDLMLNDQPVRSRAASASGRTPLHAFPAETGGSERHAI